ncbi:hypothetical protein ACQP1O_43220 (plasmid) [Nocardia sp. CA-151230]|uniref:hypothetical protein n=1 Tax=Nocardia sp. CA-151230 TaxID=3239982 RepID=UPI003D8FB50B
MEDVNVPAMPNPFITQFLVGPTCRALVFEVAELYQALYRGVVAKRTGELAKSARVSTGIEDGRWVGFMEIGSSTAYYAASHEFGVTGDRLSAPRRTADTARQVFNEVSKGAHDLNKILNLMGAL